MIVPTYNDGEILHELMEDWPSVKHQAKRLSAKLMKQMPHGRIGLDRDIVRGLHDKYKSHNCNTWSINVSCRQGSTEWWSMNFAEVETDYHTKAYYYLRAFNSPHPYYVVLIPHAIQRIRERRTNDSEEHFFADKDTNFVCDYAVFERHDCGVFMMAGKVRNDGHFAAYTDADGNTPGIVLFRNSMFYARRTPLGNFIFKTFILPTEEIGTPKFEFTTMMFSLWRMLNKDRLGLKNKSVVELYKELWEAYPGMRRHLRCLDERIIPLYP